ncbi:hypothetical protein LCGC14_2545190 [marine sediment metagenome]|uniref:Uncharacterized protein n=1 Tax=marine sediment metagenome TaxID=412755 RepID=A0A0F9D0Z5_9ZZZZ
MSPNRNRFFQDISYKDAPGPGALVQRVSRFAGMPAGIQLNSDWYLQHMRFDEDSKIPTNAVNWTITEQGAATQAISSDLFPPHLILTNAAADNDSQELQWTAGDGSGEWASLTVPGRPHYFEIMMRVADANQDADTIEQVEWFVGFAVTDTTVLDGTTDYIGFVNQDLDDDSGQDIDFTCADAGTTLLDGLTPVATGWDTDITTSGISAANTAAGRVLRRAARHVGPNDWFKLAFLVEPGADVGTTNEGTAYVYVNDVCTNIVNLADQVPDQELALTIAFQNGEAVAKILHIAYITVAAKYGII